MKYLYLFCFLFLGCGDVENIVCAVENIQFFQDKFQESSSSCETRIVEEICKGPIKHTYFDGTDLRTIQIIAKATYTVYYYQDYRFDTFNNVLKGVTKDSCFIGIPLNRRTWYEDSFCQVSQRKNCD